MKRHKALLHAKTAVIDGVCQQSAPQTWIIGAFLSDDEVNAVVLSREFAIEMERMFAGDLAQSDQIKWDQWKKRPLLQKITETFAHLFFPLAVKHHRRSIYYSKKDRHSFL